MGTYVAERDHQVPTCPDATLRTQSGSSRQESAPTAPRGRGRQGGAGGTDGSVPPPLSPATIREATPAATCDSAVEIVTATYGGTRNTPPPNAISEFTGAKNGAIPTGLRVVSAGIDSLYATVPNGLDYPRHCEAFSHRQRAVESGEDVVWDVLPDFPMIVGRRSCGPYHVRLRSPRMELFVGVDGNQPGPPVKVELRSAFLHQVGAEAAVEEAERVVSSFCPAVPVGAGGAGLRVQRVDVYADLQGWAPTMRDDDGFLCRAKNVGMRDQEAEGDGRGGRWRHRRGRVFTGWFFGKGGDLACRIYNKTVQLKASREDWPEVIWRDADPDLPVWRVEYQFRRAALTTFRPENERSHIDSVANVLEARSALWAYALRWCSLRVPNGDRHRHRWPLDPVWEALHAAEIGFPCSPLVRERIHRANHRKLVEGWVGYTSSLAALGHGSELGETLASARRAADRYLEDKGRRFEAIAADKRRRNLAV